MKAFLKNELTRLLLFVILCLIIAAILTPYLYSWGKDFSAGENTGWLGSVKRSMARADLARYFNRTLMGTALILLYPFIKSLKINQNRIDIKPPLTARINPGLSGWKDMLTGCIYAAGYAGVFFMVVHQLGWVTLDSNASPGQAISTAIPPAVGVSLIEEWLFRGVLFTLLLRSLSARGTIIGLSFFFALVHFLAPRHGSAEIISGDTPYSGFQLLTQIGERFIHLEDFIGVFLTLFTVGIILAYARYKTGYLWMSIGLHAGWIFALKAFAALTNNTGNAPTILYGEDIREGLLPLVFMCLTGAAVWLYLRPKTPQF